MKKYEHGGNIWSEMNPFEWLDFSANINPLGPPIEIINAVKRATNHMQYYPDPTSCIATEAIAEYLNIEPSSLLLTNGGISGLELVQRCTQATRALICQPGFVEYERIALAHGIEVVNVMLLRDRREYVLPLEVIEREVENGQTSTVILCNPCNPVGHVIERESVVELSEKVAPRDGLLIVDEAFIDFSDRQSIRHVAQTNSNMAVVGSLTKLFAIPGLRLGYIVAHPDCIRTFRERQTTWSVNIFAQEVAKVIPQLGGYVDRSLSYISECRRIMTSRLGEMGDAYVFPSVTNFILVDLIETGLTASDINNTLIDSRIRVRDCSNFVGLDSYFMRIAVRHEHENTRLLAALEETLCGT